MSAFFVSPAGAQDPAADFSGFRIPDHDVRTLSADVGGTFWPSRYSTEAYSRRQSQLVGSLGTSGSWWHDSDALQRRLGFDAALDGSRVWVRDDMTPQSAVESRTRNAKERLTLSGDVTRYGESIPLALQLSASLSGGYDQTWRWRRDAHTYVFDSTSTTSEDDSRTLRTTYTGSVGITVGVGRVRDASGIYDAYVLETRLKELGVLLRPLSPEARQKIAQVYYLRPYLGIAHERPEKLFWQQVERILRDDGAIAESLDAYGLLRLMEDKRPVGASYQVRQTGFFAGPTATANFEYHKEGYRRNGTMAVTYPDTVISGTNSGTLSQRSTSEAVWLGGSAELHRPLGARWQTDATARIQVPMLHVEKGLQSDVSAQIAFLMADRWLGWLTLRHARSYYVSRPDRPPGKDAWSTLYALGMTYYLEDHVSLGLTVQGQQGHTGYLRHSTYSRDDRIELHLTYLFLHDFASPGWTGPPR